MSTTLSATAAIPGIPRFYKSNLQGSNKSISVIPNFYPPGWEGTKRGLYISQNENSGLSEVEYTLLGVKREESKSILLENVFIYGVDTNLWNAATSFRHTSNFWDPSYCSILNASRNFPPPVRSNTNTTGWLISNRRLQGQQLLAETRDIVFDPSTRFVNNLNTSVPFADLTTFNEAYVAPVIYHDAKRSCVVLEGWLEPYITPWYRDVPGEYCAQFAFTSPITTTLTLETAKAFRYEPGKATTFTMGVKVDVDGGVGVFNGQTSNSKAMWGARNDTDTYRFVLEGNGDFYVERVTPYLETTLRVNRKDFIDPLDGSGKSGMKIDFSKITMYSIEFSWYGAIGANFFAYIPIKDGESKWVKIASVPSSNRYTKPALASPHMRLFTELYIPMGCKKLQSISLYGSSVYIDGNFRNTLKMYNATSSVKPIEQRTKTFITLEVPNFVDGLVNKPRNNANVFPMELNGISTVNSQVELYESLDGGSPDIVTAYRQSSLPAATSDFFQLNSDILIGSRNFVVSAIGMTEDQKIDFMRRAQGGFLTLTNPVTTYNQQFTNAGSGRLSGANASYDLQIQSLSSRVNDNRINIILDNGIYPPFFRYTSNNTANINLRNSLSLQFPVLTTYPSLPNGSVLYSPSRMPPGNARTRLDTNIKTNRAFIVTKRPVKTGTYSFDTDLMGGSSNSGNMFGTYGLISESEYKKIKNNNNFLNVLNVNNTTNVQVVSTSPATEFLTNSEYYFSWIREQGVSGLQNPAAVGFPAIPPFFLNGRWNQSELPSANGPYQDFRVSTINPLIPGVQNKRFMTTLLDTNVFTVNVDVRDHDLYFYGTYQGITVGPDNNYTYLSVKVTAKDLFSLEDGVFVNNVYNYKLLIYAHNGQMFDCLKGKNITSQLGNWTDPLATISLLTFGEGTSYERTDGELEADGSLICVVAFPKGNTQAIDTFKQKPNFRLQFKSVFLRNTQYRSPASVIYTDRNAGLFYGTFFLNTLEDVHLFVLLQSNNRSNNNFPQQIMQSTVPISRPMVTNVQLANARDKFGIPMSETPLLDTQNTTLVTELTSTVNGVIRGLPLVNYIFDNFEGVNTRVDTSTSQVLNTRSKLRRFTFSVNKDMPFTYDLTSVYGNGKFSLTSQSTSILNRDFKRFFVTAKTTFDESFGTPWFFSVNNNGGIRTPFAELNPLGTQFDAARFTIDTTNTGKNVFIQNALKTPAISDAYFIWSIYAKSLTPSISAGRFICFELKTGESNSSQRWQPVLFDIISNRIGFNECGTTNIGGSTCNWQNAYDRIVKGRLTTNASLCADTNWFPATGSRVSFPNIRGYANLTNKTTGRYVVAAHIEDVGNGWKRLSTCTYYNNNHNDNVIYIGNYTNTVSTSGNVSLWGFKEELANTSDVETLSSWYPSSYVPVGTGLINLNLTTGEQL